MTGMSLLLNSWSILRLRVWNPSGEPIQQRERPEDSDEEKDRLKAHAAPGKARQVWENPILWREMQTRAYGRRPFLVKCAYGIVLALICYYALAPVWNLGERPMFAAAYGQGEVVDALLLAGADAEKHARDLTNKKSASEYATAQGYPHIAAQITNFKKPDTEQITIYRAISNRIVEEIFDFRLFERISLLRLEKHGAVEAMTRVISAVTAPVLIVSFNDEGFISRDEMERLLAARGAVEVVSHDFKRYVGAQIGIHNPRGEKVGTVGRLRNTEYLFVVGKKRSAKRPLVRSAAGAAA